MFSTVENPARSMPRRVVLILSICLTGLLLHFFADNLSPFAQPFCMEWIGSGEPDGQNRDSGEDLFILPEYTGLEILQNSHQAICPELPVFTPISVRPLLPPPIAS